METGLVERARSGDADAFDALIEPRVEAMLRTATAIIGDPDEAREATQEALLTIWRELPSLRLDYRFDAWAGRILVNRCLLALKRRARRSGREIQLDGSREADARSVIGSSGDFDHRQALDEAFEQLEPDDRATAGCWAITYLDPLQTSTIVVEIGG